MTPDSVRDECIRHMLHILPPGNYAIITRFTRLLNVCSHSSEVCFKSKKTHVYIKLIQKKKKVNKMTCQNLAIALSPTMLRPKVETIETLIQHGDTLTNLICLLIEKPDHFFKVNF